MDEEAPLSLELAQDQSSSPMEEATSAGTGDWESLMEAIAPPADDEPNKYGNGDGGGQSAMEAPAAASIEPSDTAIPSIDSPRATPRVTRTATEGRTVLPPLLPGSPIRQSSSLGPPVYFRGSFSARTTSTPLELVEATPTLALQSLPPSSSPNETSRVGSAAQLTRRTESRRRVTISHHNEVSRHALERLGVNTDILRKEKGMKKLGISDVDLSASEELRRHSGVPRQTELASKAELIFGFTNEQLLRVKAMNTLGTTEEEVLDEYSRQISRLGTHDTRIVPRIK